MRILSTTEYSSEAVVSSELLYKHGLVDPVVLDNSLTWLYGKDSDMFPLLTYTQGQGLISEMKPKELNSSEYTIRTMGRSKNTIEILGVVSQFASLGRGGTLFEIYTKENPHAYYELISPDGKYHLRVTSEPVKAGANRYKATVQLITADPTYAISPLSFGSPSHWAISAPSVAASKSNGTASNQIYPGKMISQFRYYRFSYNITGNISNQITTYEIPTDKGTGKYWLPSDFARWNNQNRAQLEVALWEDEYNRNENGEITTVDPETGEHIPKGPGVKQILKSFGNHDTYSNLTLGKIKRTMVEVIQNRVDSMSIPEIVVYTGLGGAEQFHNAVLSDSIANQYFTPLGEKAISGNGNALSYGTYFNQYRTIDGKLFTVKVSNFFDHGPIAEAQRQNGMLYNGRPLSSYDLISIDHSKTDDNSRNMTLVAESGRVRIEGVYKGLTPIPASWQALASRDGALATRQDIASYEVMGSIGLAWKNPTTGFYLQFAA